MKDSEEELLCHVSEEELLVSTCQEPCEAFHFPMASKSRSGVATITAWGGGLNSQGLPGTAPFMEGAPRLHLWPFQTPKSGTRLLLWCKLQSDKL